MSLIRKADAPAQSLPMEIVAVEELGGEVAVRGLMLRDRLSILGGATKEDFGRVARLLAACVFDADDRPLYSVEEWEAFGAKHFATAIRLFNVASRLVGGDVEVVAKN